MRRRWPFTSTTPGPCRSAGTARLCDALCDINPLDLQSSGSLLLTAPDGGAASAVASLTAAGYDAAVVGRVVALGTDRAPEAPAVVLVMGGTRRVQGGLDGVELVPAAGASRRGRSGGWPSSRRNWMGGRLASSSPSPSSPGGARIRRRQRQPDEVERGSRPPAAETSVTVTSSDSSPTSSTACAPAQDPADRAGGRAGEGLLARRLRQDGDARQA
ncbi:MAG: hypothetical protein U0470_14530 [Anaerolineae bacterium]